MPRFFKHKIDDVGQSPYSLQFRGVQQQAHAEFSYMCYDAQLLDEKRLTTREFSEFLPVKDKIEWINLYGVHDEQLIKKVGEKYDIPSMALAGIMDTYTRPQLKRFGDNFYFSLKMLSLNGEHQQVLSENLVIVMRSNLVFTFQERVGDVFDPVRKRLREGRKRIRQAEADYLLFALLDVVVDNYALVLSRLGEKVEALEERILLSATPELRQEIFTYKKELSFLRKQVMPLREMFQHIARFEEEEFSEPALLYIREVRNSLSHVYDVLESYRELLNDYFTTYNTQLTDRLNATMQFLTIFSVIFIPLTFIAGIYGTNFDHIPELHWPYGYYVMLGGMAVVALVMIGYFKHRRWL